MKQKKNKRLKNQLTAKNAISTFRENPGITGMGSITAPKGVGNYLLLKKKNLKRRKRHDTGTP